MFIMKKIFFLITMLPFFSKAQNVGIGTTTPVVKLEVNSAINEVSRFNGPPQMFLSLFENNNYRGYLGSYSGATEDVDFGTGAGNTTGKLHFTLQAVPKLTLSNDGKFGIGTTTPQYLAHINGGDLFVDGSTGKIILGSPFNSNQWRFGTVNSGADMRLYSYNGAVETPLHNFMQNGNIGVATGTITPISRLDIKGTGTTSSTNTLTLRNSLGDTLLRMRDDGRMGIGYNGTTYGRQINLGGTGINFYTSNEAAFGGAVFPTDTSLVLWSNSNSNNYLVLQPSWGNTGIGTYTPNAKFHLNGAQLIGSNSARIATGYSLSVDGRIISEESTVMNSTSWPDYVFEENYNLMPLEELEKQIQQQKHLPNIPSAAEIDKKGIELGDMSRRLLEKVEELTLYIIELKKENKSLSERLQKIENNTAK